VTPAVLLLGAVTAERLAELWLARRNTALLIARGAREFAPGHYPAIVVLHALWLAPVALRMGASAQFDLAGDLLSPAGFARLDSHDAWSPLDDPPLSFCPAPPGVERAISLSFTPKLLRRHRRDRHLAALPRPAASCSGLLCRERCHPYDSRPVGECGVEWFAVTVF